MEITQEQLDNFNLENKSKYITIESWEKSNKQAK